MASPPATIVCSPPPVPCCVPPFQVKGPAKVSVPGPSSVPPFCTNAPPSVTASRTETVPATRRTSPTPAEVVPLCNCELAVAKFQSIRAPLAASQWPALLNDPTMATVPASDSMWPPAQLKHIELERGGPGAARLAQRTFIDQCVHRGGIDVVEPDAGEGQHGGWLIHDRCTATDLPVAAGPLGVAVEDHRPTVEQPSPGHHRQAAGEGHGGSGQR